MVRIAVISGDIVQSRRIRNQSLWIEPLKKILGEFGKIGKEWEIYRGDSFQLEISQPEKALFTAIRIKAAIRSIKGIDVRQAIGFGEKTFSADRIAESNGEAFIFSGEQLDGMKKSKVNLAIRTSSANLNAELNLILRLGLVGMDAWTVAAAEIVQLSMENPELNQQELGQILGINQSSVSERQKRAHLDEILEMEIYCQTKLFQYLNSYVVDR